MKTDIEQEQQRIYDEQLKKFIKDKKANAALKAKPMAEETKFSFKEFMAEAEYSVKTKDGKVTSWKYEGDWKKHKDKKNSDGTVQKPESRVRELARQKLHIESEQVDEGTYSHDVERAFPNGKAPGVKVGPKAPKGTNTMPKKKDDKDEPFNYDEWKKSSVKPRALPGWGKNGPITKMVAAAKNVKESEELHSDLVESSENVTKNKKIIRAEHNKLIKQGYQYTGSNSKDRPGDDVEVTHNYTHPNGTKHSMSYSAYAPGWDEDIKIKHSSSKASKVKLHSDLQESEEVVENSPFDWKGKPSVFTKKEEPTTSAQGGTIHKARTQDRNAEHGGEKEKQSVGRPKGEYGSYKIDKAKRDDAEYKKNLSQKVMNAKKDGFAARDEFKKHMHDAILRHQLRTSGIDPKDHEAQIAKKNPVKK